MMLLKTTNFEFIINTYISHSLYFISYFVNFVLGVCADKFSFYAISDIR